MKSWFLCFVLFLSAPAGASELSFLEEIEDDVGGADGLAGALGVAVSPDGRHLYTTSWQEHAISAFGRDLGTGRLSYIGSWTGGLLQAYGVTISPDGAHVYIASNDNEVVTLYRRDTVTGELTFVTIYGGDGHAIRSVALSPDGRHLYATSWAPFGALLAFRRHRESGLLADIATYQDGVDGVAGLAQAQSVATSPDGDNVYAVGESSDAIAMFRRDRETGELDFLGQRRDGVGGVDGLDRPLWVTVSGDGRHVYVAAGSDSAVAVFRRRPGSGELSFVEAVREPAVANPHCVTVAPDGSRVLVSAPGSASLAVFRRDAESGRLELIEVQHNASGGPAGLGGLRQVVTSPGFKNVYGVTAFSDSLVAFVVSPLFADGFESGDLTRWSSAFGIGR